MSIFSFKIALLVSALAVSPAAARWAAPPQPAAAGVARPPPPWEASYTLNRSTIIMSCNESGRIDPAWAKQWRVFDLDWNGNRYNADGRTGWARDSPMDCDADMAAQIAAVAQASNGETVTFVYRNGVERTAPTTTTQSPVLP